MNKGYFTLEEWICKKQPAVFLGHRETPETEELKKQVYAIVESLIVEHHVDTFLFGSKSRFCVVYYKEACSPKNRKSGTKLALTYAIKNNRDVIVLPT